MKVFITGSAFSYLLVLKQSVLEENARSRPTSENQQKGINGHIINMQVLLTVAERAGLSQGSTCKICHGKYSNPGAED